MPQPALHLLLARRTLDRWRTSDRAPLAVSDRAVVNAFLHGSLAPDMGNFPGGSTALARRVHTGRTGDVARALLRTAATPLERAFAWGWITHVIADALIHPLVNENALRRAPGVVEHVRVEVGIDVWFCWKNPLLEGLRLYPAFDRDGYAFLATALGTAGGVAVTGARLARMERGLILFSHGALHFATTVARHIWWRDDISTVPLGSALLWHTAVRLSRRNTVVNAYLTPHLPEPPLVHAVERALSTFDTMLDGVVADDAESLPNYNLEDGTPGGISDRSVA